MADPSHTAQHALTRELAKKLREASLKLMRNPDVDASLTGMAEKGVALADFFLSPLFEKILAASPYPDAAVQYFTEQCLALSASVDEARKNA